MNIIWTCAVCGKGIPLGEPCVTRADSRTGKILLYHPSCLPKEG